MSTIAEVDLTFSRQGLLLEQNYENSRKQELELTVNAVNWSER